MRALRWLPCFTLLCLLALPARAENDWIDELPALEQVARAVNEQLLEETAGWNFQQRGIALEKDDDLRAVYLVGTLVLLRRIVVYQFHLEQSLSAEREAKLKSIVAAYQEAELAIGRATGKRQGYLTTAQQCKDEDCHRRWFKMHSLSVGGASYRERILKRLYPCRPERAAAINALAHSHRSRAPAMPSPANTLSIDAELQGIAPPGCSAQGGDANANGLCDRWEVPAGRSGLDGPYCSADLAVQGPTGVLAFNRTRADADSREYGFVILREVQANAPLYYATEVRVSSQPRSATGQPLFGMADYAASLDAALIASGRPAADFFLVGAVHTHPPDLDLPFRGGPGLDALGFKSDYFSMDDFNLAVYFKGRGTTAYGPNKQIERDFRWIYLIPGRNGCIQRFEVEPGDRDFTKLEMMLSEVPRSVDLYAAYFDRQVSVSCFPLPP